MLGPTVRPRNIRGSWRTFCRRYHPIPVKIGLDEEFMREVDDGTVAAYRQNFPKRIWTVVDGDGHDMTIIAGWHLVNRMGYILTELPFSDIEDGNPGYTY
jgi:hypothetical protein